CGGLACGVDGTVSWPAATQATRSNIMNILRPRRVMKITARLKSPSMPRELLLEILLLPTQERGRKEVLRETAFLPDAACPTQAASGEKTRPARGYLDGRREEEGRQGLRAWLASTAFKYI